MPLLNLLTVIRTAIISNRAIMTDMYHTKPTCSELDMISGCQLLHDFLTSLTCDIAVVMSAEPACHFLNRVQCFAESA